MGEIKSTLDLVMERTRHLALSDDEKRQQRRDAYTRRLQGLLQQFADGALTTAQFRERLADLEKEQAVSDRQSLLAAIVDRIDPDADTRRWSDLLIEFEPSTGEALATILQDYRTTRTALVEDGETRLLDRLAHGDRIRGSAVVPNAAADDTVQEGLSALRSQVRSRILQAIGSGAG